MICPHDPGATQDFEHLVECREQCEYFFFPVHAENPC